MRKISYKTCLSRRYTFYSPGLLGGFDQTGIAPVGASLLAMALVQAMYFLGCISVPAVTAAGGFALTASHFGAQSNQKLLPLSFGASPRLGMPSLRSCSVGPPPSAIHGRRRLTRHPCRVAHCAEPPLGLSEGAVHPQPPRRPYSRPGCWVLRITHWIADPCGSEPALGGIPTMASCQSMKMLPDTQPSSGCRPEQARSYSGICVQPPATGRLLGRLGSC